MIKAGDEVVALGSYQCELTGDKITKGKVYTVVRAWIGIECKEPLVRLHTDTVDDRGWTLFHNGKQLFRKVTRPRVSASSELTKKLTEEVREGEKRKEIEYEPATANK
jgi:hypothetical protein